MIKKSKSKAQEIVLADAYPEPIVICEYIKLFKYLGELLNVAYVGEKADYDDMVSCLNLCLTCRYNCFFSH